MKNYIIDRAAFSINLRIFNEKFVKEKTWKISKKNHHLQNIKLILKSKK